MTIKKDLDQNVYVGGHDFTDALAGLPDASMTFSGYFDAAALPAIAPTPRQTRYVSPRRKGWRWEVVEYSGEATPDPASTMGEITFNLTGRLTLTVHPRRFWFRWTAQRYIRGLHRVTP